MSQNRVTSTATTKSRPPKRIAKKTPIQRKPASPQTALSSPLSPQNILQLQSTIGNRAVNQMLGAKRVSLSRPGILQQKPAKKKKKQPKKFGIKYSVGKSRGKSKAKNRPADVLAVQQQLLKLQYLSQSDFEQESVFDPESKRISETDIPATIAAIEWYQRAVVNVSRPDGLISARGGTAKKLRKELGHRDKLADKFRAFGLTQDITKRLCENGSTEDIIGFVNQTIESFPNAELKKQIGTSIINRTDFLMGTTPYRGSLEEAITHFSEITLVNEVPGKVNLHKSAADKLVSVANMMAQLNLPMPSTTVALGLRNRYRPHDRVGKSYNAHPMGFAIDYRAPANPKITDNRTIALIKVMTGEVSNFQLRDRKGRPLTADLYTKRSSTRRRLIRRFGDQFPSKTMDADTLAEARHFLGEFEREYYRVSKASKHFVTDITDYMTEARDVWKALRKKEDRLKSLSENLAVNKKRLAKAKESAKEKADALEAKEKSLATLDKEIKALAKQNDESRKGKRKRKAKDRAKANLVKKITKAKQQAESAKKAEKKWEAAVKALQAQEKKILDTEARRQEIMADLANLTKPWREKVKAEIEKIKEEAANFKIKFITLGGEEIDLNGTELLHNHSLKEVQAIFKKAKALEKAERKKRRRKKKKKKKTAEPVATDVKKVERKLPGRKDRTKFEELWQWYHDYVKPLDDGLVNDAEWVLGEIKTVGRTKKKPVMYIIANGGFFTPDDDEALMQTPSADRPDMSDLSKNKHGFNLRFMQLMALHGFDQGINWSPTSIDAMHFELVEGVQNTHEKPKPAKKKSKKKKKK